MGFRDSMNRFMYGRNGADDIYRLLLVLWFIVFLTNLFLKTAILSLLLWVILIYITFRCLSRNIEARQAENMRYVEFKQRMRSQFNLQQRKFRERKTHIYHKCPHCKTTLRLPRKKGEHTVNCPKCHQEFPLKVR